MAAARQRKNDQNNWSDEEFLTRLCEQ